ncbi:MAG: flagellar assembly protein FliW [Treponema sp.]|uniref:flagellar assembly protein FliW n=1 Tax=Treponema sp. TaxID=166 RepID=UPI001B5BA317|nr:flagellar assembly protein FliW [Treponema sp.]MBP5402855.1 flagellar assembly protein FliW [Treponema sp.]MBR5933649.1 flagellar assembly protein FliW [Treponema sp.]
MDVKTKQGTVVSVDNDHIFNFPEGLFGFELYHNYAVYESEYSPFMWMQSIEDPHLAFLIVDPFLIVNDYELDVDDKSLAKIGISSPTDVFVMTIVTIPQEGGPVTANLQGPVIINKNTNQCLQVILNSNRWTTKHDIVKALKEKESVC